MVYQISSLELTRLLSQISGLKTLGLINCKQLFMSGMFLSNQVERKTFHERLQGKKVREEGIYIYLAMVRFDMSTIGPQYLPV